MVLLKIIASPDDPLCKYNSALLAQRESLFSSQTPEQVRVSSRARGITDPRMIPFANTIQHCLRSANRCFHLKPLNKFGFLQEPEGLQIPGRSPLQIQFSTAGAALIVVFI